jgi:hypothetical protein
VPVGQCKHHVVPTLTPNGSVTEKSEGGWLA